jgi:monothiol glutaredoxin
MSKNVQEIIAQTIHSNDVVLFMKGTRVFPQCGFSGTLANILDQLDIQYRDINVLDDDVLRQGIKEFSNWPTIPQLYVHGEFIGGCDIVREMYEQGELRDLLTERRVMTSAAD